MRRHFLFGLAASIVTFFLGFAGVVIILSIEAIPVIPEVSSDTRTLPLEIVEPFESAYDVDNLGCWGDNEEDPRYGPISLPNKLVLTTICGTLYARDKDKNLVWVRYLNTPLFDRPQMIGKDLVVIAGDLNLVGLDPKDGVINWKVSANGRAFYTQLVPYSQDSYLVLVDMSNYDDKHQVCVNDEPEKWDICPRGEDDKLWLMKKDDQIDGWNVPARSKIEVERNTIYSAFRQGSKKKRIKIYSR